MSKILVLHIELPEVYADDLSALAMEARAAYCGEPTPEDYLFVVTEALMRREVGLTVVTLPGQKTSNHDFEVHAYNGIVVGAGVRDVPDE